MAVRASIATGDFTAAGTWGLVDATSYLNDENSVESVLTSVYSQTRSAAFTPGAIEISHLAVKLSERVGTTGTMSVSLRNATIGLDDFVTGTEVTIDVADLPAALEIDANGGWIVFKLASPVTLLAATDYNVQAKTSSASQVELWCNSTVDNLSRCLITTTTGAPAAGDDLIIAKEHTGQGTSNSFTVTMDNTATTDFGAASTSLVTPALAICTGGTLTWGVAASTAYYLKLSGNLIVYAGGTLNMGTVATQPPTSSSQHLQFDCGANVDFGLTVRNLGTFVGQGASKTVVWTHLNTDEAAAATVIGVVSTAGWAVSDVLCFASTTRTKGECENKTILTVDSGTQVTLTAGLTYAHSGTSPTRAEVGNLTRNVKISGMSTTLQSYVDIKSTATVDLDYVEFYWLGSAVALKGGIQATTTSAGSFNIQYCSIHDFVVTGSDGINLTGSSSSSVTISNNVLYNINAISIYVAATSGSHTISGNLIMLNVGGSSDLLELVDLGSTVTNNVICGSVRYGVIFSETNGIVGTFDGNTIHSNGSTGLLFNAQNNSGTITNLTVWRNAGTGINVTSAANNLLIDGCTAFGNTASNISLGGAFNVTLNNITLNGDTTFATTSGISVTANSIVTNIYIENSNFGTASGIKTAHTQDILLAAAGLSIRLHNTIFASGTEISGMSSMYNGSYVSSQKHDQTTEFHVRWSKYGFVSYDKAAAWDVLPSVLMLPTSASNKLEQVFFRSAVTSGNSLTVSCKVRESITFDGLDYNGSRIRLIVKKNVAAGIASDTVLATATVASEGAFETIQGTTAAVTDDAVLEFAVDCDGTTGWINVDTFTVTSQVSTLGLKYWQDGIPIAYGDNSGGSGGARMVNIRGGAEQ